jgi:hypothetical protein
MSIMDRIRKPLSGLLGLALCAAGCASKPQVITTKEITAADAPYRNVLVIALFESFDVRRYLEKEILADLAAAGVEATAMTSMTDTRTIINRDTVIDRAERTNADGVLVIQLISLETTGKQKDANPDATYIFRPTYYYNVWSVDLTEYVEPPYMQFTDQLALSSEMYSAQSAERAWSIRSDWTIKEQLQPGTDYKLFTETAKSIVDAALDDKVVAE